MRDTAGPERGGAADRPPMFRVTELCGVRFPSGRVADSVRCQSVCMTLSVAPERAEKEHAFLWRAGELSDLGTLVGRSRLVSSAAYAIAEDGSVAGTSALSPAGDVLLPCLWTGSLCRALPLLPDCAGGSASGVASSSVVVGACRRQSGASLACVWRDGSVVRLAGGPGESSSATAVNEAGLIAGWATDEPGTRGRPRACVWREGELQMLASTGGSTAFGISPNGWIAGTAALATRVGQSGTAEHELWHAFLWLPTGATLDLGTLPGGVHSAALGVNSAGVAVGYSDNRGALWCGGATYDASDLLEPESAARWRIRRLVRVTDDWCIIAQALLSSTAAPQTRERPVLLVPVSNVL